MKAFAVTGSARHPQLPNVASALEVERGTRVVERGGIKPD